MVPSSRAVARHLLAPNANPSDQKWVFSSQRKNWLAHPTGGFSKSQELSLDDLPHEFNKYETLAKLLDMRSSSITMLAQGLGIDPAVIDYFQKNKEALRDFEEFKKWREDRGKPKKPEHEPRNQKRRRQQVAQAARHAPPVTSEVRPRQERPNWEDQQ